MTRPPQQPEEMEMGLLNPHHGLEGREPRDYKIHRYERYDFFSTPTAQYFGTKNKQSTNSKPEQTIQSILSSLLWPHLLVSRCHLVCDAALRLDNHSVCLDVMLSFIHIDLQVLGCVLHGLRLIINCAVLLGALCSEYPIQNFKHQLAQRWFDIAHDCLWLISAFIPSGYLVLSCILKIVDCILIAIRATLEIRNWAQLKASLAKALKNSNLEIETLKELTLYDVHVKDRLNQKYKQVALNIGTILTTALYFVLQTMIIPTLMQAITGHPVVLLVIAVLALFLALINRYYTQSIEDNNHKFKIETSNTHLPSIITPNSFFSQ